MNESTVRGRQREFLRVVAVPRFGLPIGEETPYQNLKNLHANLNF